MKKIIGSRGIGKTASLILYAEQNGIKNILCSAKSISHCIELAHNLGVKGIRFFAYNEAMKIEGPYLVDDVDKLLQYCDTKLVGYTVSIDD